MKSLSKICWETQDDSRWFLLIWGINIGSKYSNVSIFNLHIDHANTKTLQHQMWYPRSVKVPLIFVTYSSQYSFLNITKPSPQRLVSQPQSTLIPSDNFERMHLHFDVSRTCVDPKHFKFQNHNLKNLHTLSIK